MRQLIRRQTDKSKERVVAALHRSRLDDRNRLTCRVEHGALDTQRFRQPPLARLQRRQVRVHADHACERSVGPLERRRADRHDQAPTALRHVHGFQIANRFAFAQRLEGGADGRLIDVGRQQHFDRASDQLARLVAVNFTRRAAADERDDEFDRCTPRSDWPTLRPTTCIATCCASGDRARSIRCAMRSCRAPAPPAASCSGHGWCTARSGCATPNARPSGWCVR